MNYNRVIYKREASSSFLGETVGSAFLGSTARLTGWKGYVGDGGMHGKALPASLDPLLNLCI